MGYLLLSLRTKSEESSSDWSDLMLVESFMVGFQIIAATTRLLTSFMTIKGASWRILAIEIMQTHILSPSLNM